MQQRVITTILLTGLCFALAVVVSGMSDWRLPDDQQGYAPKQPIAYSHRLHAGELQIDCRYCHFQADRSRYAGIPSSDVCMKCHQFVTASYEVMLQELQKVDEEKNESTGAVDTFASSTSSDETTEAAPAQPTDAAPATPTTAPPTTVSPEMAKLYKYLALDEQRKPIAGKQPESIPWVRVHNLPDYVVFNHQAHVTAGVTCQYCHGPVETMERMRQYSTLSMGWCVHCHRDASQNGINGQQVHASTNCSMCHH